MKAMKRRGEPIEWLKIHGSAMQRRGEPDLSITYHGRSVKAELKSDDNTTSPLQDYRLRQWRAAGAITGVVRSVDDLEGLLRQAFVAGYLAAWGR